MISNVCCFHGSLFALLNVTVVYYIQEYVDGWETWDDLDLGDDNFSLNQVRRAHLVYRFAARSRTYISNCSPVYVCSNNLNLISYLPIIITYEVVKSQWLAKDDFV